MDIHTFINQNTQKYNSWLQSMFPHVYPIVCDNASDILASYLIVNFKDNNIKIIQGVFNGHYHFWIEVDGKILDFTIVQFINDYDINKPFIDIKYYSNYTKVKEYEPSFTDFESINNFDTYLSNLN
jgi:hypothetical protein